MAMTWRCGGWFLLLSSLTEGRYCWTVGWAVPGWFDDAGGQPGLAEVVLNPAACKEAAASVAAAETCSALCWLGVAVTGVTEGARGVGCPSISMTIGVEEHNWMMNQLRYQ